MADIIIGKDPFWTGAAASGVAGVGLGLAAGGLSPTVPMAVRARSLFVVGSTVATMGVLAAGVTNFTTAGEPTFLGTALGLGMGTALGAGTGALFSSRMGWRFGAVLGAAGAVAGVLAVDAVRAPGELV
ncbi:MAG: hypothetical protein JWO69_1864 [Thermoleophilia bacterium]|nr:hypothetical protein [Thermoleophilia bacterium]